MSEPLISVVTPFFDNASYVVEAVESALAQTHTRIEVVLVDDGSTDGGWEAVQAYADRATLIRQENQGAGPARNAGIAAATGELIAFLDADDLWEPMKLERQVAALGADPSLDVVTTMVREFLSPELDPATAPLAPAPEPRPGAIPSAMLMRRAAVETVGAFNGSRSGHWADWWTRFVDAGLRSATIDEVLTHRRLHLTNLGYQHRAGRAVYLRALKASLDRRREAQR